MITNWNTCGLFESNIQVIAEKIHKNGSYLFMDGANMNALFGKVNFAELGVDVLQINLHKSLGTPHGAGGPGRAPVLYSKALSQFIPFPRVVKNNGKYGIIESPDSNSMGRMKSFHGQFSVLVKALAYMLMLGGEGLKQSSADAVMNANYMRVQLRDTLHASFPDSFCLHEVLFDDKNFDGFSTMDVAKAILDAGFHPPTVYFPTVVSGAMLFEPTESESKEEIDHYILALKEIIQQGKKDPSSLKKCPISTPIGRPDETRAAKKPILSYQE
jgi:glycine dehydrogenase subunit 2